MIKKNYFEKHYPRLVFEAIVKSAFFGLICGFAVNFLIALAAWIFDFGGIWLPIGVGVGVALVSGVVLYFVKFRPTTKEVARRVDRLGLEERLVTMLELQNDDSYIAMLQRENAKQHLDRVANRRVRLRLSNLVVVLTVVAAVFASSMTTVVGLAENDIIPSGSEVIVPEDPLDKYLSVSYIVDEGGEIIGEPDQLVLPGEDATTVVAVAEDGWIFVAWSDESRNPERTDENITESVEYFAIFEEIVEGDGEGEDGDGQNGQNGNDGEGDKAEDLPSQNSASAEGDAGAGGEKGDGQGSEGNSEGAQGSGDDQGEGKGEGQGSGAGGKWEDSNQFIDGKTYYKDQLEMYYEWAQQIFEETGEIPPELREFFETYYDSI